MMKFFNKNRKDKNVFKVNLGKGIETLSYAEMEYRFSNLTEEEQKYLNENVRHCTSLITIPENLFDNIKLNVTSISDTFKNCNSLNDIE